MHAKELEKAILSISNKGLANNYHKRWVKAIFEMNAGTERRGIIMSEEFKMDYAREVFMLSAKLNLPEEKYHELLNLMLDEAAN